MDMDMDDVNIVTPGLALSEAKATKNLFISYICQPLISDDR